MAKAERIWLQLAIAAFYLSMAVLYATAGLWYDRFSFDTLPGELLASWPIFGLFTLAWLLSSTSFLYRASVTRSANLQDEVIQLKKAIKASSQLLWRIDADGIITEIDGRLEENHDLQAEDFLSQKIGVFETINPDFYSLLKRASQGEYFNASCTIGNCYYRHEFSPLGGHKNGNGAFQCLSVDKSLENKLNDQIELARQIFGKISEAIVILDRHRMVTSVNHAFTEMTFIASKKIVGTRGDFEIVGEPGFGFYRTVLRSLKKDDRWRGEIPLRRSSGQVFTAMVSANIIREPQGMVNYYLISFSELTQLERSHEELRYLADHDNLTDLPNRRLFLDRLGQGIRRAQRSNSQLAVYYIDLDNFKFINDSYGHHIGDEILKTVGRRLLSAMRHSDTVARLAGDEFTVITENVTDTLEINSIAQKIMSCFASSFSVLGENLELSASVGIGVYPEDGDDMDSLLKGADEAMYKAKAAGRDGFYRLSEGKVEHLSGVLFFPSELRLALMRGQMELVYQPLVDLRNGRVVACEGLLRWNHHARGVISPTNFMTLSEDAGITDALGKWSLDEACQQFLSWRAAGVKLDYVSINMANSQINDPGYVEAVTDTLSRYDIDASSLMLEIAEGILLRNFTLACNMMANLSELGVRFCIDEFGSFSGDYNYIRDIPADTIKIEQRVVARAGVGREDNGLIRALVGIGGIVGKNVVAVGVERPGQEALLKEVGCRSAQGYLYAKPMSAETFGKSYIRQG